MKGWYKIMTYVTINCESFEVSKNLTTTGHDIMSIFDIYERPSFTKIGIYDKWMRFMRELGDVEDFSLRGNCMMFTITARVRTSDKVYHFVITKAHNRVNVVEC